MEKWYGDISDGGIFIHLTAKLVQNRLDWTTGSEQQAKLKTDWLNLAQELLV